MGKTYIRVDDRMIHGQTIVAWAPALRIEEIIGVDDVSASNPMLKSIMTMSVPKQYKTQIVTVQDARKILSEETERTRLVIVKVPHKVTELKDVLNTGDHIYLGNMAKRDDTNHQLQGATGIFYLSDSDIDELKALAGDGYTISFRQLPNTAETAWEDYMQTFR